MRVHPLSEIGNVVAIHANHIRHMKYDVFGRTHWLSHA